jgi:hypothetical protein
MHKEKGKKLTKRKICYKEEKTAKEQDEKKNGKRKKERKSIIVSETMKDTC